VSVSCSCNQVERQSHQLQSGCVSRAVSGSEHKLLSLPSARYQPKLQ